MQYTYHRSRNQHINQKQRAPHKMDVQPVTTSEHWLASRIAECCHKNWILLYGFPSSTSPWATIFSNRFLKGNNDVLNAKKLGSIIAHRQQKPCEMRFSQFQHNWFLRVLTLILKLPSQYTQCTEFIFGLLDKYFALCSFWLWCFLQHFFYCEKSEGNPSGWDLGKV